MVFLTHRDRVRRVLLSSAVLSGAAVADRARADSAAAGLNRYAPLAMSGPTALHHPSGQSGMQATTSTSTRTPSPR